MQIRYANTSDIEQIFALEKEIFNLESYDIKFLNSCVQNKNSYILAVFCENNKILGYAILSYIFENADLLKIAVDKNYRKQHIATDLFNFVKSELKKLNVENIFLEVDENNVSAINFYEKIGFIKFSERKNYYKNGNTALLYNLSI